MTKLIQAFEGIWVSVAFAEHGILPPIMQETISNRDDILVSPASIAR